LLRRAIGASLRRPSVADDWQDYQGCAGKSPAVPQPKPLAFKLNPEFKGDFCKIVEGVRAAAWECGGAERHSF
jgi:hypothetical protein